MTKRKFMAEAYELAKLGQYSTKTGVNVGCVIVKNNKILSRGWYEKYGGAHAEINAINGSVSYTHLTLPTICSV